jgi:hypothetical protein
VNDVLVMKIFQSLQDLNAKVLHNLAPNSANAKVVDKVSKSSGCHQFRNEHNYSSLLVFPSIKKAYDIRVVQLRQKLDFMGYLFALCLLFSANGNLIPSDFKPIFFVVRLVHSFEGTFSNQLTPDVGCI